jgi:MFS family permease
MSNLRSLNSGFHHLFNSHFDKEFLEIAISALFFYTAKNLISLALPFYLYVTLHYSLSEVFLFFVFWQISFTFIMPFVGGFISKVGLKHSMSGRRLFDAVFYLSLPLLLTGDFWMDISKMIPLFIIRSFFSSASEISYDIFLTHHVTRESKGKMFAWLQIGIMGGAVLAPIIGGLITKYFGFTWASILAFVLFLISGGVLFLTSDEKFEISYTPKKLLLDTLKKTPKNLFFAEFGRVFFDAVMWLIWPIFLVITLKDVVSMGVLVGVSSGIAMIVAFFVGKKIDANAGKGLSQKILHSGAMRSLIFNFARGIVFYPTAIGIFDACNKVNDQTMKVPYDIGVYKWLCRRRTFEKAHIRWFIAENTYTISTIIFALSFYFFEDFSKELFIIFFVSGSFLLLLMQKISKI